MKHKAVRPLAAAVVVAAVTAVAVVVAAATARVWCEVCWWLQCVGGCSV